MPRVVLLSPHLDDAAFSCGGLAARLAAAGFDVALYTIFTASIAEPRGFALECQTSKGIDASVDYMKLRRLEDAAAALHLGCTEVQWRGLPEAPHRGYETAEMLFEPPLASDQPYAVNCEMITLLRQRFDLILAPQCWGRHVDHVQLVDSLMRYSKFDMPLGYWEDTPYILRDGAVGPPKRIARGLPKREMTFPIESTLATKLDACAAYASQLGFQFGSEEAMRAQLSQPFERLRVSYPAERLLRPFRDG